MRISVFGEAMVEFDSDFNRSIAGDTLNVSAVTAYLGAETTYYMRIAEDIFISDYKKVFETLPLKTYVIESSGNNGIYFIKNKDNGERLFQYYRKNSAASHLKYDDLPNEFYDCDVIFNSGITAAISETCREAVLKTFKEAKTRGIKTAFDCNYRASLWEVERAHVFLKELIPYIDILFLSEDDLQVLKDLKHSFIVLRKGMLGSEIITHGETKNYPALKVQAIDTTGAGDAYAGAFLKEYLDSKDIEKAANLATKIASLQVQIKGGLPSSEIAHA